MAERVVISRLGRAGDGIAETEAGPVAVPYGLPGETVLVEPSGAYGRLIEIEAASADRVDPFCPYYVRCGGCIFQHLDEKAYAIWKHGKVTSSLKAQGLSTPVEPLRDAHGSGRRRMVLHLRPVGGTLRAGFMGAGSHRLVPIEQCPITVPDLHRAPAVAERLGPLAKAGGKPLDVAVTATAGGLDVELRGGGPVAAPVRQALIEAAQALDLARLAIHGDLLVERRSPVVEMGRAQVAPPSGSFLQATAQGEATLAAEVVAAARGARRIADLFSGIGPFALRLAETAEVHAVEGQGAMLAALDRAARNAPGLRRVTTETRDLFRRPLLPPELERHDLVVLDPPRQGAEAQVRQILASSLERVIMVSCDAGTFARDAATLAGGGFVLERVVPVDQFKWSPHVEIVGVLRRPPKRGRRRR